MNNKKPAADLDESEWDFREIKVPASEIEACFIFEHAREVVKASPRLTTLATGLRAQRKSSERGQVSSARSEITRFLSECFDTTVKIDADFPDTSWQELAGRQRVAIMQSADCDRRYRPDKPLVIALNPRNETDFKMFRAIHSLLRDNPNHTQHGFIAVDWSFSDETIKAALKKALLSKRPMKSIAKRKARGQFRDMLNCLAALRLLRHYGPRGLLKDPTFRSSGIRLKNAPYRDLSDLYKAKKKAERLVHGLLRSVEGS